MVHEVHAGFLEDDHGHALALVIHRNTCIHHVQYCMVYCCTVSSPVHLSGATVQLQQPLAQVAHHCWLQVAVPSLCLVNTAQLYGLKCSAAAPRTACKQGRACKQECVSGVVQRAECFGPSWVVTPERHGFEHPAPLQYMVLCMGFCCTMQLNPQAYLCVFHVHKLDNGLQQGVHSLVSRGDAAVHQGVLCKWPTWCT